ncbi:MAG: oligosaccharide flippase family protein [Ignavibacteria bacterium]|nr:oligosaccharide flippase family protein [Ignavibacteria bacterium]
MHSKIRSLATDTVVYGVSTVLGRFLTFFLTPLYSNFLSASEIGDVAAIYAMIAFIGIVYSLGLEPAFMRFWKKDDEENNSSVFRTAFLGVAVLSLVPTACIMLFAQVISTSAVLQLEGTGASIVQIAALIPFFDALVLIPFLKLRIQRKPGQFAVMRLLSIVVNVVLNGLFLIGFGMHTEGVVLAGAVSSAVTFLIFIPSVRAVFSAQGGFIALIKPMLKYGLPTVPASLSSIIVQVADRPVLLMLTSSATVGMYQTNFRLALPLMMFVTVFEYAWKPFYLTHRDDADAKETFARVLTLFTVACGVIFLATSFFMPYVVRLPFVGGRFINPNFWPGLHIIPIIMLAYFFNGVFINVAAGLHISMKTIWLPVATGAAALLNIAATFLLVPRIDYVGAAWAKVVAYIGSVLVLFYFAQRIYPIKYNFKHVGIAVVTCGLLYLLVGILPKPSTPHFIASTLAIAVYGVLLAAAGVIGKSTINTLTGLLRR